MAVLFVVWVRKNDFEPDCPEKLVKNWPHITLVESLFWHVLLFLGELAHEALGLVCAGNVILTDTFKGTGGFVLVPV